MDLPADPAPVAAPETAVPAPEDPAVAIPAADAPSTAPEEAMPETEPVPMEEEAPQAEEEVPKPAADEPSAEPAEEPAAEELAAPAEPAAAAEEAPAPAEEEKPKAEEEAPQPAAEEPAEEPAAEAAAEEPPAAAEPLAGEAAAPGEGPSDDAVKARLREVLKTVDLGSTTEKMLRKQLEGEFGADLSAKKALVRAEVEAYLAAQAGGDGAEGEGGEEEDEEEAGTSSRKRKTRGGGAARFGDILSEPMAAFLGLERCPRTMVVKKIWEYVKAQDLQDPRDRRRIILDDKLKTLFPGKTVNMFSMQKHLSKHVFVEDRAESSEEEEEEEESGSGGEEGSEGSESEEEERPKKRRAPAKKAPAKKAGGGAAKPNGFTKACKLAPDLAAWMGVETASRPAITSHLWKYAKERDLQDPANRQFILADATLEALTGEKRFKAFSFSKLIKDKVLGYAD